MAFKDERTRVRGGEEETLKNENFTRIRRPAENALSIKKPKHGVHLRKERKKYIYVYIDTH